MKRRAATVLLFLVGGATINVAVAWACAMWITPANVRYRFGDARIGRTLWTLARFDTFGTTILFSHCAADQGEKFVRMNFAPPSELATGWSGMSADPAHFANDPSIESMSSLADGRGFPFRALALHCSAIQNRNATSPVVNQRWLINLDPTMSSPIDWGGWATFRSLPLRPIWHGFAINTIFYAAILWMLFALPFALRRRIRIKRGQCASCGYSLKGRNAAADVCPECGAACKFTSTA